VNPPNLKELIKIITINKGNSINITTEKLESVYNQEKTLLPVGKPTNKDIKLKYRRESQSISKNIW